MHAHRSASTAVTPLGEYLQRCGATWGDSAFEEYSVESADDGRTFTWRVDLPEDRLQNLREGEPIASPVFTFGPTGGRARFELYPKGDGEKSQGACSLWLLTAEENLRPLSLRVGSSEERKGGASSFCSLKEALAGGSSLEVRLQFEDCDALEAATSDDTGVEQSLQLTGLDRAEWRIFGVKQVMKKEELVSSPPFRFHHVLLGDMYLELLPGPELCTLFFRCRVPTMRLQVGISVGSMFSKSFVALGKADFKDDLQAGSCLEVNLDAPGVLSPDGSLIVNCALEKVVSIPSSLRDMMPRLDERALWPKRL